ncbi:MAG: phosphatidate cytidylyltransferase [Bacteroidota bacterium]
MKNNFTIRVLTAIVFSVLLIGGTLWHPISFFVIFLTVVVLGLLEFYKLVKVAHIEPQFILGILLGIVIYTGNFLFANSLVDFKIFLIIIPILTAIMIIELYREKENPFSNIAFTIFGASYISIPFAILSWFVFNQAFPKPYYPMILIGFFFLIWANDSGAYIVGSLIGRNKLFERISPKKTWEGFIGGGAFSLLAAWIISFFVKEISLIDWFIVALITFVFGTFGDLIESLLKRMVKVKDSGHILPGHGGILDRFDSIIVAAPMVFIYLMIILK